MREYNFCFRLLFVAAIVVPLILGGCGETTAPVDDHVSFAVLDVGQGLAQIGLSNGVAIAWDLGPRRGYHGWSSGYRMLGSPHIAAIVLSHSDEDHRGGLTELGSSLSFDGLVIMSPFEDTALVRRESGVWKDKIRFAQKARGDTIGGLDGVLIECLWPPREIPGEIPLASTLKNRYSFCFRISFGETSVFMTSDVDSVALAELAFDGGYGLKSDVMIVPHHGSRGSIHPGFYGFVLPRLAIVSCGYNNPYGHPHNELFDLCFRMQIELLVTYAEGHILGTSNKYYWKWETVD